MPEAINQSLAPLGLYAQFTIDDDEKVHLEITQMRQGKFEIPVDQLAEWAEDPQKIIEQLEVCKGPSRRNLFSHIDVPFDTDIIM